MKGDSIYKHSSLILQHVITHNSSITKIGNHKGLKY